MQWLTSFFRGAAGTPRSPPSPPDTSSSATMSPVYPDRPIRPMPRRSLRARLSPEVADTIDYPPAPTSSNNTLFHPSYADNITQKNGAAIKNALRDIDEALYASHGEVNDEDRQNYKFKANELESEEEDDINLIRQFEQRSQHPGIMASVSRASANGMARNAEPFSQSVASSNDSIDGYDSFENTNNKKKRKIPTSGPLGNQNLPFSSSLSQDLANMGLTNGDGFDIQDGPDGIQGHHNGTGSSTVLATSSGNGISGSGRGRFGRPGRREISNRGPLTSSMNSSNAWQTGRFAGSRRDYGSMGSLGSKSEYITRNLRLPLNDKQALLDHSADRGIISQAIADAASLPQIPNNGQENVSLLEQQSVKKPSPANTQFTFTCEPEASKGVFWPGNSNSVNGSTQAQQTGSNTYPPPGTAPQPSLGSTRKDFNTQGTQTSPSMANQPGQNGSNPQAAAQAPRKPRRSAAQRYAITARNRRADQQYNNYHHPPKLEDIWICEFCEYESIFGRPPEALIRQYEIKDRKERKRQAEKRRLLEKAKMKGRKGKKGTKNSAKNNTAAQQQQAAQPSNKPVSVPSNNPDNEEYFHDGYEADGAPVATHTEPPNHLSQSGMQPPAHAGTRVADDSGTSRPG